MPDILIRHADVITLDAEGRVLRDVEMAISNTRIVAVGVAPVDFRPMKLWMHPGTSSCRVFSTRTHTAP